jgi:hypothetical protein
MRCNWPPRWKSIPWDTLGLPVLTLISADEELNVAATAEGLALENPYIH